MSHNLLFEELIQTTIRRIGQVTGTSVQTYSEDLIGDMIQHKFDVMFEEVWWNQFMYWLDVALDETTGVVTVDLSTLEDDGKSIPLGRFEDIHSIFIPNSDKPLPRLSDYSNPDNVKGTTPRYIEAVGNVKKIFRILPVTAEGSIKVRYRSLPDAFETGDIVEFDKQALVLGAAFDYLEDDGTNPGATAKLSSMFESRVKQLKKSRAWLPHKLDPHTRNTVDEWFSR